ncbi:shikimate dehydrogenase [Nocardioides donggukensis]|uniref:Shikimate dehydrogenase n=1 Tax=Nocardioides donggukensis TaxID=2774019 RepID=A0A927K8K6_9ACTN|nr:shikimate dehydrogenase [Nocardioides donggukensis]MBD8869756.1 shikimate dehydrogenase [Nocardioides donggukensis]
MRCAVLGDPIGHSLSPVLHRAGYAEEGLDWTYEAHRVVAGGLPGFLAGLDASWRGLSLTMPLKREAAGIATTVTDRARLAGAANTLVLAGGGVLADNTDIPGAVAAVRERGVSSVTSATVLGGGATATSLGLALVELGATRLRLLVRSPDRAEPTLVALRSHPAHPEVSVADLASGPVTGDAVVSTIPAAAQGPDLVARCREVPLVFEALYDPWPTPLADSVGPGRILVGGLDLLVHQAALQFEAFTGRSAPLSAMREAGETALRER